jgi:hypothetical protein
MVLAERVLLSSPPASRQVSELASLRALLPVSLEQSSLQPLAQVSLRSSGRASLVSIP